jgi:hypothetical protein
MRIQEIRFLDILTVRWKIPMKARRGAVQLDYPIFRYIQFKKWFIQIVGKYFWTYLMSVGHTSL